MVTRHWPICEPEREKEGYWGVGYVGSWYAVGGMGTLGGGEQRLQAAMKWTVQDAPPASFSDLVKRRLSLWIVEGSGRRMGNSQSCLPTASLVTRTHTILLRCQCLGGMG